MVLGSAQASGGGIAHLAADAQWRTLRLFCATRDQAAAIARAWSQVHGFTMLLLDGRLADILRRLPEGTDAETLLDAMLRVSVVRPAGS
jgi:hypothetical protein